jgi:hypothetical protein
MASGSLRSGSTSRFSKSPMNLIRTRGDPDADLAPGFLNCRILGFDATYEAKLVRRFEHPRLGTFSGAGDFRYPDVLAELRRRHRLGKTSQMIGVDIWTCSDACRTGFPPPDNDDGRIGDHIGQERVCVHHVHEAFKVKRISNVPTQRAAVAVLDPAIRADEAKVAPRGQKRQRALNERHVDIGAIEDRTKASPIFSH